MWPTPKVSSAESSTASARTDMGHENAEGMAQFGTRLTDMLGTELMPSILLSGVALGA